MQGITVVKASRIGFSSEKYISRGKENLYTYAPQIPAKIITTPITTSTVPIGTHNDRVCLPVFEEGYKERRSMSKRKGFLVCINHLPKFSQYFGNSYQERAKSKKKMPRKKRRLKLCVPHSKCLMRQKAIFNVANTQLKATPSTMLR